MTTIDDRLNKWQQDLLDLSNRNRLINFKPSSSRPSSLQLIAPPPGELFRALLDGKCVVIVGRDEVDESEDREDLARIIHE